MRGTKIYHVELYEPDGSSKHYYFGSKAAVCKAFDKERLGISYKYLTTLNIEKKAYIGRKAIIRVGRLITTGMI